MVIPPVLAVFVANDPDCPAEWLVEHELLRILRGEQPPTSLDTRFLSLEDLSVVLSQRNYAALQQVRIPPLRSHYELVATYYALPLVETMPSELVLDIFRYALTLSPEIPSVLLERLPALPERVREEWRSLIITFITKHPRLLHEQPALVDTLYADRELHRRLLVARTEALTPSALRAQARELHIHPFLPRERLLAELTHLAREVTTRAVEELVAEATQRMLRYWQTITEVEFRTSITGPTNEENCLAEATLEYGTFDTIPVLEGKCLYLLTAVEWKTVLQKKENPWTRQPLDVEALERVRARFQATRRAELPEVPRAYTEALSRFRSLYEPPVAPEPIRNEDPYVLLAEELSEFYVSEENLRALRPQHLLPLRMELFISGVMVLGPMRDVANFLRYLYQLTQRQPATRATIALALLNA